MTSNKKIKGIKNTISLSLLWTFGECPHSYIGNKLHKKYSTSTPLSKLLSSNFIDDNKKKELINIKISINSFYIKP
ncbi:MAG: hypothetical protein COX48_01030 [bacterium (Candidatus Stahlbacteria) CG23_combo_of_CG06-09_8_20_14_all_34_7]|nr:MAG: hypothetical protein COX48_01030 [bacterium (Candidatus Stahlbacteria) CG23_combo_of_CG06-09_8_20_14_all_34_7]